MQLVFFVKTLLKRKEKRKGPEFEDNIQKYYFRFVRAYFESDYIPLQIVSFLKLEVSIVTLFFFCLIL